MPDYRIISSDTHSFEPYDLWTTRIDTRFKERAPKVADIDGRKWWVSDGLKTLAAPSSGAQLGVRFENPEALTIDVNMEEGRPGGYIPEENVKDMDADGVDVNIIYPGVTLSLWIVPDSELLSAIFRVYNDWLAEFCSANPTRLKGIAALNTDDVQDAVAELERSAKIGLIGGMISVYPPEDRPYDSREYDPLWAAAQDLQMPLSLHLATNRPGPGADLGNIEDVKPRFVCNMDYWVRCSLSDIIYSGVLERFPKLQIGSVEHELSWIPHFLDRLDFTITQRPKDIYTKGYLDWMKNDMLPSDYFHRNVFCGFQEDGLGIRDRHIIGVDNLQWGSDYPHPESTFPRSRDILEEILADCNEEEKAKITGGNAARTYNIN